MAFIKSKFVFVIMILYMVVVGFMTHMACAMDNNSESKVTFLLPRSPSFFATKIAPKVTFSPKKQHFPYPDHTEPYIPEDDIVPQKKPVLNVEVNNLETIENEEVFAEKEPEKNNVSNKNLIKGAFFEELQKDDSLIKIKPLDFILIDDKTLDMSVVDYSMLDEAQDKTAKNIVVSNSNIPLPPALPVSRIKNNESQGTKKASIPVPPKLPFFREGPLVKVVAKLEKKEIIEPLIPLQDKVLKDEQVSIDNDFKPARSIIPIQRVNQKRAVIAKIEKDKTEIAVDKKQAEEDKSSTNEEKTVAGMYILPTKPDEKAWLPHNILDAKKEIKKASEKSEPVEIKTADNKTKTNIKSQKKSKETFKREDIITITDAVWDSAAIASHKDNDEKVAANNNIRDYNVADNNSTKEKVYNRSLQRWEDRVSNESKIWQAVEPKDLSKLTEKEEPAFNYSDVNGVKIAPTLKEKDFVYGERLQPAPKDKAKIRKIETASKLSSGKKEKGVYKANYGEKLIAATKAKRKNKEKTFKVASVQQKEVLEPEKEQKQEVCDLCDYYDDTEFGGNKEIEDIPVINIKNASYEETFSTIEEKEQKTKELAELEYQKHLNAQEEVKESIDEYRDQGGATLLANAGNASVKKKQPLLQPIGEDMPVFSMDGMPSNNILPKTQNGTDQTTNADDTKSFMDKLSSLFGSSNSSARAESMPNNDHDNYEKDLNDNGSGGSGLFVDPAKMKKQAKKTSTGNKKHILPSEIRVSFAPDEADISGNTIEWISRFADNVVVDRESAIEVRMAIDYTGKLQTKRFSIIQHILEGKGVYSNQIIPIFSSRDSDSIVLRVIKTKDVSLTRPPDSKEYVNW